MNYIIVRSYLTLMGMWLLLVVPASTIAGEPSQLPLFLSVVSSKPNIMIMLDDSGSMTDNNVYAKTTTPALDINSPPSPVPAYTCNTKITGGATTSAGATTTIKLTVTSANVVKVCTNATCGSSVNFSTSKCFDTTKYYKVAFTDGTLLGTYIGLTLDWYFKNGFFTTATGLTAQPKTTETLLGTRIAIAKQAAKDLVDSLIPATGMQPTVRLGLTTYNGGDGGKLHVAMSALNSTVGTAIKDKITALPKGGTTPLAETLADIGRYFTTGYTDNLILHPSTTAVSRSISTIFNSHSIKNNTGVTPLPNPIESYCQKSYVILISDGLPNGDRSIGTDLTNYTGDCGSTGVNSVCDATATTDSAVTLPGANNQALLDGTSPNGKCPDYTKDANNNDLPVASRNYYHLSCKNGTKAGRIYETGGSDFLDDVAQALYEMDLRPNLGASQKDAYQSSLKNNLTIYAIGFADESLIGDSVLKDAAVVGGGRIFLCR